MVTSRGAHSPALPTILGRGRKAEAQFGGAPTSPTAVNRSVCLEYLATSPASSFPIVAVSPIAAGTATWTRRNPNWTHVGSNWTGGSPNWAGGRPNWTHVGSNWTRRPLRRTNQRHANPKIDVP